MEYAIDDLLYAIDHRGGDATGLVAIGSEGDVEHQKASCKALEFCRERRNIPGDTRSILLHTRMATQGSPAFPENNHPIRRGAVYVVHNGHIWNDFEIFRITKRERFGQVDSEAIAALIAKYGIMNTHKAMEKVSGAAAIGVVDETRPGVMALARGSSSPLMFYRNEHVAIFASEKHAVAKAWRTLFGTPPNDKHIEEIKEGTVLYLNGDVERQRFTPDDYYYSYTSSAYKTPKGAVSNGKWEEACEVHNCWKAPFFTTITGMRLCEHHKEEYLLDPVNFDPDYDWKDASTIYRGSEALIICSHGCVWEDCISCNPDDEDGSFLPAITEKSSAGNEMVTAKRCELCDLYFPEDEMFGVQDWDDNWVFCKDCMQEMSEIVRDCETTRPYSIHKEPLEDVSSVNYVLTEDGGLYPMG